MTLLDNPDPEAAQRASLRMQFAAKVNPLARGPWSVDWYKSNLRESGYRQYLRERSMRDGECIINEVLSIALDERHNRREANLRRMQYRLPRRELPWPGGA